MGGKQEREHSKKISPQTGRILKEKEERDEKAGGLQHLYGLITPA
jgi:hypothetical protein